MIWCKIIVIVFLCTFPVTHVCADIEDVKGILSGYRFIIGIRAHSMDFDVEDEQTMELKGTLSEDISYSPFLILASPYKYFGDTNAGTYVEYGFGSFQLNQQAVGGSELVDLGTSVKGRHVYVTPAIFYNFGEKMTSANNGHSFKIGIGVGVGYASAEGDIIFTETTGEKHTFDMSGIGLGISVLADYRWKNLMVRAVGGSASIDEGQYTYSTFDFSMDFGYVHAF
jgi:hypothetical protein